MALRSSKFSELATVSSLQQIAVQVNLSVSFMWGIIAFSYFILGNSCLRMPVYFFCEKLVFTKNYYLDLGYVNFSIFWQKAIRKPNIHTLIVKTDKNNRNLKSKSG